MISAKVIQDSVAPNGKRITTFELEYHRFILAEVNTHCLLARNTASSRAIPTKKQLARVIKDPAVPVHIGKNQGGMQADGELGTVRRVLAKAIWRSAGIFAAAHSALMHGVGVHKQVANRLTEPFVWSKTVITATEFANFFYLRDHPDAQPEIQELARAMLEAVRASTPLELKEGEWHVPYVRRVRSADNGRMQYYSADKYLTEDEARQISSSCCAQVSFRALDESLEKALKVYKRLVESEPAHASPFMHQATPLESADEWSGNFKGWQQYRKTMPNEAVWETKDWPGINNQQD